jgi:Xaa-Pro aminopeptidase
LTDQITREKAQQAIRLLSEFGLDTWLLLGQETGQLCDPSLPLVLSTTVTWKSAFLLDRSGERLAIVGRYDVGGVEGAGAWSRVIGYDEDLGEPLRRELFRLDPQRIGLNYSLDNPMADGLTVGLYFSLLQMLEGTPFRDRLASAEGLSAALRGDKSDAELALIQDAVAQTLRIFAQVPAWLEPGVSERELAGRFHTAAAAAGAETSWDRDYCPTVNCGARSLMGHNPPSAVNRLQPGDLVHIDFGLQLNGYCSDLQRCWYLARPGEDWPPAEAARAASAVAAAISAAAAALRPGAAGWEVDQVARRSITEAGYPEYKHAVGHQVGRACHDGGTTLGPLWPRYGSSALGRVRAGEVYTLELGVETPAGPVSIEEMVLVTAEGCRFLAPRQTELFVVKSR